VFVRPVGLSKFRPGGREFIRRAFRCSASSHYQHLHTGGGFTAFGRRPDRLVSFECAFLNKVTFLYGTSSCKTIYDPLTQSIDRNHTYVVIGGRMWPKEEWGRTGVSS
jgi:hypothetical protein